MKDTNDVAKRKETKKNTKKKQKKRKEKGKTIKEIN